jgi:phage terminase small subunit
MSKTNKTKAIKGLTRKQQAFVDHLINHPKDSATKAALATYGKSDKPLSYATAGDIASSNLEKPLILARLKEAEEIAQDTLLSVMATSTRLRENAQHASVAKATADSILDRLHGKATQRIQSTSTVVTLSLDLSA